MSRQLERSRPTIIDKVRHSNAPVVIPAHLGAVFSFHCTYLRLVLRYRKRPQDLRPRTNCRLSRPGGKPRDQVPEHHQAPSVYQYTAKHTRPIKGLLRHGQNSPRALWHGCPDIELESDDMLLTIPSDQVNTPLSLRPLPRGSDSSERRPSSGMWSAVCQGERREKTCASSMSC